MSALTERRARRLPAVDAAWLRMDVPANPMVITTLFGFADRIGFAELHDLVQTRLLRIHRFRQRVVESRLGRARWEDDPDFDLGRHLHRVAVPSPGGAAEVSELVSELGSRMLDRDRPLWQLYVIEGLAHGSAVLFRLHHCIGDGVALVAMMLGLTDEGRGLAPPEVGQSPPPARTRRAKLHRLAAQIRTLARLLALPPDPPNPLRGALGTHKRLVACPPLALAEIKRIGAAHGATVNDVVVTAVVGGLRHHLAGRGYTRRRREPRALMPMYLRDRGDGDLGNHFGMVYLDLPLGIADPIARLAETHRRMKAIKGSPEATVALEVLGVIGIAPQAIEDLAIALFTAKASAMITNVAGPPGPLHFVGHQVTELTVWAPVSGRIGLGISALSYAGMLRLGVEADVTRVPEPERLAAAIAAEFAALAAATPLAPSPEAGPRATAAPTG